MDHRDSVNQVRKKRSFAIKLSKKPHKPLPEVLRTLRTEFNQVDINEIDLSKLNLSKYKKNNSRERQLLETNPNPFGEDVEQFRKIVEEIEIGDEDRSIIESSRRGRIICDPETETFDLDILMPNKMAITLSVNGKKILEDIKFEAIQQSKRLNFFFYFLFFIYKFYVLDYQNLIVYQKMLDMYFGFMIEKEKNKKFMMKVEQLGV